MAEEGWSKRLQQASAASAGGGCAGSSRVAGGSASSHELHSISKLRVAVWLGGERYATAALHAQTGAYILLCNNSRSHQKPAYHNCLE